MSHDRKWSVRAGGRALARAWRAHIRTVRRREQDRIDGEVTEYACTEVHAYAEQLRAQVDAFNASEDQEDFAYREDFETEVVN